MSPNTRGVLFALAAFGFYATHDAIVKTLGGTYSPFQIIFFSVLFSFPLTTIVQMRDRSDANLLPRHPWWTVLRTLASLVSGACAFYAFTTLPLAQVYAILFASPLVVTVLSIPILGETVRMRRWAAVIVGLIGVVVVIRPGNTELTPGHFAAIASACLSALASVIVRKIGRDERSVVLILYPLMANFLFMGALLPFVYVPVSLTHLGGFFLMSLLGIVGTFCVIAAYRAGEAALIAPMQYSQIIWATAFGLLFFDETPDMPTAIGVTIIIASGIYIVFRESRRAVSETQPVLRTRSRLATPGTPRVSSQLHPDERDRGLPPKD